MKKYHIPAFLKIILLMITPFIFTLISLYIYGEQIINAETIFPNISIIDIDVSGKTRDEALLILNIPEYEERIASANVSFLFPDDSILVVSGKDIGLQYNARDIINNAFNIGRGQSAVMSALLFLERHQAAYISYTIDFTLDSELLDTVVTSFAEDYNNRLNKSVPLIFDDRIVFTKGAGHVSADIPELIELTYNGIFESLETGNPVEITYNLPETNKFVDEILAAQERIFIQVLSSEFDLETNTATKSAIGVNFDPFEAVRVLRETLSGETATVYLTHTFPEYTQEHLDSLLFRDLLGERTTFVHGTANRLNNVELSSEAIDGLILLPDEEFSFNNVVGQRTVARGYKTAPILIRGEFVPGIGGGICQTSSTIFAAIKPTELLITEQRRHGRPVPYLPWGWDAAVSWGTIDFRFVNNTNYPLRIDIEIENRYLTVSVYGTIIENFPIAANWNNQ